MGAYLHVERIEFAVTYRSSAKGEGAAVSGKSMIADDQLLCVDGLKGTVEIIPT